MANRETPFLRNKITRILPALALIGAMFSNPHEVRATHAMGGDLTYECLGNNQYRVKLSFYRDCNGVAAPTNCNNGLRFYVSSAQCGANFNDCFSLQSVSVITPICASETDRCLSSSGTYGVEKYVFTKVISLAPWAGCGTDWTFRWDLCCRNNAITSLQNPGNQNLYLEAKLNNTLGGCNSSPTFLTNPAPFYCLGQSVSYNPGAFDADGDSLVYSLINPRGANGNNLAFNTGYSTLQPILNGGGAGSVQLNSSNGTLTVTPNSLQVAVLTYLVREFRNGVQIGSVTRDVQVVIRPCPGNTAPVASGINGTGNYFLTVCAGTPITFTVNSSDPNPGNVVSMTWNNGIPGATFSVAGSPFPTGTFNWTPTAANIGTNLFTVNVVDNACPLTGANDFGYTIQVTPPLTPANAGPDQSVCGSTTTLAGVQPYQQSPGQWTIAAGSGVFANPASPTTQVTGLSQGLNTFEWTVNYATCGVTSDQVNVFSYNPAQAAANAGPDQSLCLPANSTTLAGNPAVAPAMGTWTLLSGTGTIAAPNSPTTTVSGLGVGVNSFRWTINNGPCGTPTNDVVNITVYSNLQGVANAGPDQQLCAPNTSAVLNGNAVIAPATGQWTVVQGSGTFANANSPNTTVSGLGIGTNTFRWSISNGPCTPAVTQDDITVLVFDPNSPAANAGPDQQICSPPFSASLQGNTPTFPATGTWTLVSGAGTIASPNSPTTAVSNLGPGTNVFRWTLSNGPCAGGITTDQVSVVVFNSSAAVANAGPDQSICSTTSSVTLAGSPVVAPATGLWSVVSGTATITDPTNPTTTVTNLGVGQNILQWTVNNGPCGPPTSDAVTVLVYSASAPAANAGPDQSLCTPTTSTTLAGNAPLFPATGTWTLVSGSGTITNPSSPTSAVTGLGVGTNVFRWSITNGPCANPNTNDLVVIQVFNAANPVANAGPDQQLCTPTSTATLAGSALIAPATGTWTLVSGSGTITAPGSPNSTVNGLAVGQNVFRWTVNNGPCGASTNDLVSIFVFDAAQLAANAGPDQQLCTPNTSTTLAGSPVIFPGTGTWSVVSGSATIADPGSPTSAVSNLAIGVNILQWTVSNGPCGPVTSDQVSISVFSNLNPVANAGPDQSICIPTFPNSVNLQGSVTIAPAVGTWTLVSGSGSIASPNSPTSAVNGLGVGTNIFQWTVSNGPCGAVTSDQVAIVVFDASTPVANAGPDQDLCTPITTTSMQGSPLIGPATGTWTLVSGSGVITNPGSPTTGITGLTLGTNVFQWTVSNGPCSNPVTSDQVTINVFSGSAQQADAGPDQTICSTTTSVTLAGNAPVGLATGIWTVVQGSGTFTNATQFNTTVTALGIGQNIFRWSIDNGACGTSFDQMSVFVYDNNNPLANAGPDQSLCTPNTTTIMAGSVLTFPAVGTWNLVSGTGNIVDPNSPTTQINGLGVGANVFQWTVNNGPCAVGVTTDQVIINVFDDNAPTASAGPDQSVCTPVSSVTMAANPPVGVATGTWTLIQGGGIFANAASATTTVSGLQIGLNTYVWTLNNGPCGTSSDTVSVLVFDANAPVANAGPDQELCLPQTTTNLAGSPLVFPATGTWALIAGTGTIASPNTPNTGISGLTQGVNVFTWTVSNGPCTNGITVDTVVVQLNDPNNADADAGPDQAICTPLDSVIMDGSSVSFPATGQWMLVSGTGTITDPFDPGTSITGLAVGSNVFQWDVDNGGCANGQTADQVEVLVYDQSVPDANAGPDQQLCSPTFATTLAGSAITFPATGTWTLVSGAGTITDPALPTSTVTGMAIGENVFRWTVNNGPCGSGTTFDEVSIFIFDATNADADAGPDQSLCTPTLNTVMTGSPVTFPAQGTWSLVSGSGTIADVNSPVTGISGLAIGENIFSWTVDNGPCANGITTDLVSIFVYSGNDPAATAGPDQEICTPNDAVFLTGSPYTFPATGTWTLVSGTGSLADATDPNTEVTGLSIGENIFQWTVDAGPCTNGVSSDQVSIFVFDANNPVANAGPDQQLCSPAFSTTLAGSPVTFPAVGTWTLLSGTAVIQNPNSPTSAILDLEVGETVLLWTVSNGPCANGLTSDTLRIRVFDAANPIADAGDDQQLCTPNTTATMDGSAVIFPAEGTWSLISGTGTITDPNDPSTTITGLSVGENIFTWTVSNGPCANGVTTDQVSIFIYDLGNPPADAGPDIVVCSPLTEAELLGNNPTFPSFGTWTIISGPGSLVDPNDPNTRLENLQVGTTTVVWTVDNGPCAPPFTTDTVVVNIYESGDPSANAGPDQQVCTPVTQTNLVGSPYTLPATGTWVLVSGTGTIVDPSNPSTLVTGLGVGENIFEWQVDNASCGFGATTDQVSIFLFDLNQPPADAGADQQLCSPDDETFLNGSPPVFPAFGVWTVNNGNGTFSDATEFNTLVSGLPIGVNTFTWTVDNGICGVTSDQVDILVFDSDLDPADAGPGEELCAPQDSTILAAVAPTSPAYGTWTLVQGAGQFDDVNDPATQVSGLAIGDNIFSWTVYNGPCNYPDSIAFVTITLFDDSTSAADAGPDLETCLQFPQVTMDATTPQPPATGTWVLLSGSGTPVDPNDPTTDITGLQVGISEWIWSLNNGPCANNGLLTDTVLIYTYDPNAPLADAGPDQQLCTPDTTTVLQGNTPLNPGVGTWTLVAGTGDIFDVNDPQSIVTGLSVGDNIFAWTIYNGQCGLGPPSVDTVIVTVYDASQAEALVGADQEYCTPVSTAVLDGNPANYPAIGTWSVQSGQGGFIDANDPTTTATGLTVGVNVLVWTIDNGACGSSSDSLSVLIYDGNAPPADAGPDQEICIPTAPNTVNMAGNPPVFPATAEWTIVSGTGTVVDPNDPNTLITDLDVGITVLQWTIINGPCDTTFSQMSISVYDAGQPNANAGPDQELCSPSNSVVLSGNVAAIPATGTWSIASGSGTIADVSDPNTAVSDLPLGTTALVWTIDNGPCSNGITSDTLIVTVYDSNSQTASAGPDQSYCTPLLPPITMLASSVTFPAIGTWALLSGSATLLSPGDPFTEVIDLQPGENIFEWTVDNGVCGTTSDQMSIFVFDGSVLPADAGDDLEFCQDVNTTELQAVAPTGTAVGTWSLLSGTGNIATPGDPLTTVSGLQLGHNVFLWTLNNGTCGNTTDTMLVHIEDCLTLIIPDAFSPNGDGVNDNYVIYNLESYPRNSFQVFNRWGNKVLDRTPYSNDWNGLSEGDMNWGEQLPESTYYYVLDLGNGDEAFTGYIYLRR